MDPENTGELQMDDFLTGLERLGMLKHDASDSELAQAEKLFHALEMEDSHCVTLASLDEGALDSALDALQTHLAIRFGSVEKAFMAADPEGKGELSHADFRKMCHEAKFTSEIHRMIMYLDPEKTDLIDLALIEPEAADIAKDTVFSELNIKEANLKVFKKRRRNYFRPTPYIGVECGTELRDKQREVREGFKCIKEFKKSLTGQFGSLPSAWFKFLSPEGEDSIDFKVFADACGALKLDFEPEVAWEAWNPKQGTLSLRELDPNVDQDLTEFHARMIERYGSVENAIDATDTDGSYEADYDAFLSLCFECQYRRNERRLFEYYGGEYGKKGSKIELGKLDEKALEAVKTKRQAIEGREKSYEAAKKKRLEVQERRKKGLPDEPTEEELEAMEEAKAKEEAKRAREEQRQKKNKRKDSEAEDGASVRSGSDQLDKVDAPSPPAPPPRAGEDPAKLFVAMLVRRFGTLTRAWRVIDCEKQVALNQSEFSSALRVTGYGGSATVLWNALGCTELVALKDLDPEVWQLLSRFRHLCKRRLKGMRKVFRRGKADGDNTDCSARLDFEAFSQICIKIKCPRPWDTLFDLLDVKCVGSITWEEVKFLDEDYRWVKGNAVAVRRDPTPLGGKRNEGMPNRTTGIGHLGSEMKPRKVFLPKSNSLPDINLKLRPNWNDRHTIFDNHGNKSDNLIHLMKYVKVEDETRIARRVKKKIEQVPTDQWLAENMSSYIEEEDDDDDGWAH